MDQIHQTTNKGFYDLEAIKAGLSLQAEHWVPRHFQSGQRQGAEWRLGNIQGQAAKIKGKIGSCAIRLIGDQAGSFYDFATQEQGGPLQTLGHATGLQGKQLFAYAADLVGHLPIAQDQIKAVKRDQQTQTTRTQSGKSQNRIDGDKRRLIEKIWMECIPCGGNIAEAYFTSRGLQVPSSSDLLFHPNLMDYSCQKSFPALVAGIRDAEKELIGIHRTYLHQFDGQWRVHSRKMLGRTKGGWVCLNDPDPAQSSAGAVEPGLSEVIVGEGIETVLSVATVRPQARLYACLSAGGLKAAPLPSSTSRALILADNDSNNVGLDAAQALTSKWLEISGRTNQELDIDIYLPPSVGQDFNDVLQDKGLSGIQYALATPLNSKDRQVSSDEGSEADAAYIESQRHAAKLFGKAFEPKLRYAPNLGKWFLWQDAYWKQDDREYAYHLTADFCQTLKGVKEWERGKAHFIAAVLRIARTDPALVVNAGHWNADPWLLGTPGGTVDLKTATVRPAKPVDYISKQAAIGPLVQAGSDRVAAVPKLWLRFLNEATSGDQELVSYLQRVCGYFLTGVTSEHALFFVYGSGGNGKSVFLNTLTNILGDYARTAAMETFTSSNGDRHPTELAMLEGARLVSVSETEEGRAWAESRIKLLTGGDKVSARFMRQDFFEYTPQFKLLIVGNHKPVLRNVDEAARRRFNIIPFVHKPVTPDQHLEEKLKAEYPAILAWMVKGCLAWRREGLSKPEAVVEATDAYFDDQDLVGAWLNECCDLGDQEWETSSKLYASWKAFAERNGEYAGSAKSFAAKLAKRGFSSTRRTVNGATARCYEGISQRYFTDPASEVHNR